MAIVTGTIVSSAGAPIRGAKVEVTPAGGGAPARATSAADGTFRTPLVDAGAYNWAVTAPGHAGRRGDIPNAPRGEEEVRLGRIVLDEFGVISGRATDPDGAGVTAARVEALDPAGRLTASRTTAGDGRYRLPSVPADDYRVTVTPPPGFRDPPPRDRVRVAPGTETPGVDFVLAPIPGAVFGRVTDDTGVGRADAAVTATAAGGGIVQGQPAPDGAYRLPGLAPGRYRIAVLPPGGFDAPPATDAAVLPGRDTGPVDFRLTATAGGVVAGRVTDGVVAPTPGAAVRARDAAGAAIGPEVQTDGSGAYRLPLPAGVYRVGVTRPGGYLTARNVAVATGEVVRLDFSLDPVTDLGGRLDADRFTVEPPVRELVAARAADFFPVAAMFSAGAAPHPDPGRTGRDVLGVMALSYGLRDQSLRRRVRFNDEARVRDEIGGDLQALADELERSQADAEFMALEARRQFDLGRAGGRANAEFPPLFHRLVNLAADPALATNLRSAAHDPRADPLLLARADGLLRELKVVVVRLVRSLGQFGTAATRRLTARWAAFEAGALEVLVCAAGHRRAERPADANPWVLLADLTGRDFLRHVAPHVALAAHGGKLLRSALAIYGETRLRLDDLSPRHLLDLFQPVARPFWTTRLRAVAEPLIRYPLQH